MTIDSLQQPSVESLREQYTLKSSKPELWQYITDPASVAGPDALKTLVDSYNGTAIYDESGTLIGHVINARWTEGGLTGDVAKVEDDL